MTQPLSNSKSCLSYLPLLTPAVTEKCKVDYDLLNIRLGVTIVALVVLTVASVFFGVLFNLPLLIFVGGGLIFSGVPIPFVDYWLAERGADTKAAQQYLDHSIAYPTAGATDRIAKNLRAATLLAQKGTPAQINKLNEKGEAIFEVALHSYQPDFHGFQLLAAKGNITKNTLLAAASHSDSRFLECVLQYVKPSTLSKLEQFQCLFRASNLNSIHLLVKSGIDLECRDERENTPLLYVIQHDWVSSANVPQAAIVETLLKLGANPYAQNKYGKNAFDLAKFGVVPLLEPYRKGLPASG